MRIFRDRAEVGRALGRKLARRHFARPVVLALPRGGVAVAVEIARALDAPLDLMLVRKIGAPGQPELALGAVVEGDPPELVVNRDVQSQCGVSDTELRAASEQELREISRQRVTYLRGRPPVALGRATAIVVDDGIATGATVRAALRALRRRGPARVVLAVGVAPPATIESLRADVDEIVCLRTPTPFDAVGLFYDDFGQLGDDEVIALLDAAARPGLAVPGPS